MYGVQGRQSGQHYSMSLSQQPYSPVLSPPAHPQVPIPVQHASLIQPPALVSEEQQQGHPHYFKGRTQIASINNQVMSEFDGYPQPDEEGNWGPNEAHIASMFWEQRCGTLFERFDWFYERFQILKNNYATLSDEMQRMDSEEEWHLFQQHHDEFQEKLQEMEQELSTVLAENEQLMQQRRSQDSETVWQQRYQELLGNFKSLQAAGGVSMEQYRTLEGHYNELEYQYGLACNEIQQIREQRGNNSGQFDGYREKVETLHKQNVELHNMLEQMEQQCQELREAQHDPDQIQQLMGALHEKDSMVEELRNELKQRPEEQEIEEMLGEKERNIAEYQNMLAAREREMMALQQQLSQVQQSYNRTYSQAYEQQQQLQQMQAQINNMHNFQAQSQQIQAHSQQLQSQYEQLKGQLQAMQAAISQKENQLRTLQQQISTHKQATSNTEMKLAYANKQVDTLHETLRKNNEELVTLRGTSYELERLRRGRSQHSKIVDQRDQLLEKMKKLTLENQQIRKNEQRMAARIEEANNPRKQLSLKALRTEVELLTEQGDHLEAELQRWKATTKLKEEYGAQLEQQLGEARERMAILEQVLQEEREGFRQLEVKLSNRGSQHQSRIKDLDYSFNIHLKQVLEKEVAELRAENRQQQEALRQAQEKQLGLSTQVAVLSKQQNSYDKDIALLKAKQRETQAIAEGHKQRYHQSEESLRRCNEELKEERTTLRNVTKTQKELQERVDEQQRAISGKIKVIRQMQAQLEEAMVKAQRSERVSAQNARLRNELDIIQHEQALMASKGVLSPSNSTKQLNTLQHSGIIQRLGQENQCLKDELADVLKSMGTLSPTQQPSAHLQQRLNDFKNRLQTAIGRSGNHQSMGKSPGQGVMGWQGQRAQLVEHYEGEIRRLKSQPLAGSHLSQNKLSQSAAGWIGGLESERLRDEVAFLREKNSEQEERNSQLIKVNDELQRKIDSVLKGRQGNPTLDYYKEQCERYEKENEGLKGKLKQVGEECRGYRLQLATKNTKISQQYEFKVQQLELAVQQQQRKIVLFQSERVAGQDSSSFSLNNKASTSRAGHYLHFAKPESILGRQTTPMQQEFYSVVGVGSTDSRTGALGLVNSPRNKYHHSHYTKY